MLTFTELDNAILHCNLLNLKTNPSISNFHPVTTDCELKICTINRQKLLHTLESMVGMRLSRRQRLFKVVLMHLCFEAALQILPDSGAADGILWNNLSKYFLGSEFVGWLLKHTFSRVFTLRKTVRIIAKLQWGESCRQAFKGSKLLTPLCLYRLFERNLSLLI